MAGTAVIQDSRIHHYTQQGISVNDTHATIARCHVDRGLGLNLLIQNSGILLNRSWAVVDVDTVTWHRNYGIRAAFLQSDCAPPGGAPPESLVIRNSVVLGAAQPVEPAQTPETGISLSWICQEGWARVESDSVAFWTNGLEIFNCSDSAVRCVAIRDNYNGVLYERSSSMLPAEDGPVVFDRSRIKSNYKNGIRAIEAVGLWLFVYSLVPVGLNTIQLDEDALHDPKFMHIDAVDSGNPLA
jgi:hypothetical protein